MRLLHIDSSILGANSASRELTRQIVAEWQRSHPLAEVIYRDLAEEALPHLSQAALSGADAAEAQRNAAILGEFMDADVVVVGAPLYNFSVPSQLKAWIDRISVAGKTFRYTASGPEGLAGGKRVILAISRGGVFSADSPAEHGESYLRALFAFLGVQDLTVVRAEGLAYSPQHRADSMRTALAAGTTAGRTAHTPRRPRADGGSPLHAAA